MDSSVSETHGAQEESAYNGHFGCTCCHPLFVFNQFGDLERCSLRSGNVHGAADWRDMLAPAVARYRHAMKRRYFRGDAADACSASASKGHWPDHVQPPARTRNSRQSQLSVPCPDGVGRHIGRQGGSARRARLWRPVP